MAHSSKLTPIVMAIAVNKEKNCEHVVIGEKTEVQNLLAGSGDAVVLFDEKRPLGTFLVEYQMQSEGDWNQYAIFPLKEALHTIFGKHAKEAPAWEFLHHRENSHNPIDLYAAHMCQFWYREDPQNFEENSMLLTKSFKQELLHGSRYYRVDRLIEKIQDRIRGKADPRDAKAEIQYCWKHQTMEYIFVTCSFYPAVLYYLTRLKELKYCFCQCSVCGKLFLAPSGHHSLCSDACAKIKNRQNKREFDERARKDLCSRECKNVTQRMRNRINRMCKHNGSEKQLAAAEAAFKAFQKEAIDRKKKIKTEEGGKRFIDWLFEQERLLDDLCSEE